MKGINSKLVHGQRFQDDSHKAIRVPIYDSAAFEYDTAEEIEQAFLGKAAKHAYSRITNPTVSELERRVNFIAGGLGTVALSSGMAAVANVLMTICKPGDNIITSPYLFGNTFSIFEYTLKKWGLEARFTDLTDLKKAEELCDENTRAIFFETITNPQMVVFDIEALGRIARKKNVLLIADNTTTTPYLFQSKKWGVNIEVISSTKYMSGGGTSIGGMIIDQGGYDWSKNPSLAEFSKSFGETAFLTKIRKEIFRNLGSCLSPHSAYMQTLGLETMALRIDKSCRNTLETAIWLQTLPQVKKVNYPGLTDDRNYSTAKKFFEGAFGGVLTFELKDRETCYKWENKLKMIRRATNINDNKTLAIHPASTIYCSFSPVEKEKMGVTDGLIRLSVGIEDCEDIKEDILQAMEGL